MTSRRVPERTCVGCRAVRPKKELTRIVRDPDGRLHVDPTGKLSGRGAYICPDVSCLDAALRGKGLERALRKPLTPELIAGLRESIRMP